MKPVIHIKRVYEKPTASDGYRILIDGLWPRGITRKKAAIDEWAKNISPSPALRKWFSHDPERWKEFQKRYLAELKKNGAFKEFARLHNDLALITLIYAAKDTEHNHALVLQQLLQKQEH